MKTAAMILTVASMMLVTVIVETCCIAWDIVSTVWGVLVIGKERGL